MKFETLLLHTGNEFDPATGALSAPIQNASTYRQADPFVRQPFDYLRSGNPTRRALENVVAALEGGTRGFAFASGMAAVTASLLGFLSKGDHVVFSADLYGGTYHFAESFLGRYGVEHTFADSTDLAALGAAFRPETKVLFLESPSNPLLKITDVRAAAALGRKHGAFVIIDNTFMSPALMRPLELGVDVVVHSATKFLGGHSDLLAGCVVTNTPGHAEKIYAVQNLLGGVLPPQDAWLLMRGIKTLAVRMKAQEETAASLAKSLSGVPWVKRVHYPGLPGNPGHDILAGQASGFGAVLSVEVDTVERVKRIIEKAHLWSIAVSLGGVESILSYPARMSHASVPPAEREKLGITDTLFRLSAGLEAAEDLFEDFLQAGDII
jgi:cystathionine beta-lyase/cystathionine gamma-synthase